MNLVKKYSFTIGDYFRNQNNHAAALAYYSLFALIPIVFVSLSIFGRVIGQDTVEAIIENFLINQVGIQDTTSIMGFLVNTQYTKPNLWMELLSIAAIFVTTSAMTSSVKRGLNDVLKVPFKKRKSIDFIKSVIQFRILSILAIAVFMILMIIVYFSQLFIISVLDMWFIDESILFQSLLFLFETLLSLLSYFLVFLGVYRFGHDAQVTLKEVVKSAIFSSFILCISQFAIKYYLQHFFVFKDAGLTGTILVLLTWIYFTSQILYLGAHSIYMNQKNNSSN
jgi:membrane protein